MSGVVAYTFIENMNYNGAASKGGGRRRIKKIHIVPYLTISFMKVIIFMESTPHITFNKYICGD